MWKAAFLFCALILVFSSDAFSAEPYSRDAALSAKTRPLHELDRDLRKLLREHSAATTEVDQAKSLVALCHLHAEFVSDPRWEKSDTLKMYRNELAARLRKSAIDLKRRAKPSTTSKERASQVDNESDQALDQSLAVALQLADFSLASPQQQWAAGNGGAALQDVQGLALVELIERTLNPQFWDRAGGPGTIVYYAPLQCLVVRATSEMHDKVGGAVGGLRKAGR